MNCSRREFFTRFGQSVACDVSDSVRALRGVFVAKLFEPEQPVVEKHKQAWVRPPGALPESRFLDVCTRCTDCQTACPYDAIRRLGPELGDVAGTPAVIPDASPCYLCEDMPCVTACEPHALMSIARQDVRMGTASIDENSCYQAQGQPCDYCVTRCPIGPTAIRFDKRKTPVVNDIGCTGCGVCAYLCPPSAIRIIPQYQQGTAS